MTYAVSLDFPNQRHEFTNFYSPTNFELILNERALKTAMLITIFQRTLFQW